ncbi:Fe-S metabolism protein SufE [Porphyromonas crevioricanis]|uniref:Cysteine desulfuration protein sufE n=1 Tax=Porphyromonas crevioricanis TaxID=393921 RepID=A0A0A2G3N0_9PORP|nr:SufE family protein [Porphyromonas crevioricanis]KGN89204.1 Fe-S metabolism protein SufE [Porphyromonas crevioricanis]KGN96955.1 Fe-S metabolism protein SufE [Porphyromonas crevioricanis]GAD06452.1 sulfur acceptor protein SufE for iron-sulfur cluster assembly [Porphyromonas crevioricanis JCM 13913]SQH72465.1 Cysteine desulfuration protein sufE [Porphyromonas crevioricanis]
MDKKSINEVQDEIVEEFGAFDDWMDKYALLIDLGSNLEGLKDEEKKPEMLIEGCQSRVWIVAEMRDGRLHFRADSDALIVKGLVALLLRVLDNRTAKEIAEADLYFIQKMGLSEHLSPTRSNGLLAMLKQMKYYAVAFSQA